MSNRNTKTKEELRRYDIFKGIVAILIGILLLLSIATGAVDPNDLAGRETDAGSTAATSAEETGTTEEEAGEIEISAPELSAPELGSELQVGPVPFSGTGTAGSQVAVIAGDQELGRSPVDDNGEWEVVIEIAPGIEEIELQALDSDGNVAATSPALPFTVSDGAEEIAFTADPLPDAMDGLILVAGSGQPGYQVAINLNGRQAAETAVNEDGAWAIEIEPGQEAAEVTVTLISPDGEKVKTINAGQIEAPAVAPEVAASQLPLPDFSALTGALTWEGQAEPGSRVALLVNGEPVQVANAGPEGQWTINFNLQPGTQEIAFGRLDEDGNVLSQTESAAIEVPGELPKVTLPAFSLSDDLLAFAREEPPVGESGDEATDAGDEATDVQGEDATAQDDLLAGIDLDGIELQQLLFPLGLIEWNGRTEPGSEVAYLVDGEVVDTATAAEDGSFSVSSDLTDEGEHTIQLGVPGDDGELIARSRELLISVADLDLPTIELPELSGDETSVTVGGSATAGETVEVTADGQTVGVTTADENGRWSLDFGPLPEAANLRAQVVDENGSPLLQSIPLFLSDLGGGAEDETLAEGEASISGTITFPEPFTLPDDAVVNVQILDISTPGAAGTVIGEQTIEPNGQPVPIPFEVAYDPADIVDNHTYSVAVRIEDSAGNLLFVNDTAVPIITNNNPTEDVLVETVKVNTSVSDIVLDESEDLIGEEGESIVDAAVESDNFSTLLNGLQAAGLTETLQDVEAEYTLFAPTDEAFQAIPPELAEAWDAYPESYEDLLRHMVVEGKYTPDNLTDGQVLTSLAGKDVLIERDGEVIFANGVPVVDYAEVGNSAVYATPQIILPLLALNENLPIIDESGVPTFVGPLLTVVGLGEPGMEILLTVDGENFGDIATVEPNGFWLVKENVESGVRYILAYMYNEEGLLQGISQEVVLPVP